MNPVFSLISEISWRSSIKIMGVVRLFDSPGSLDTTIATVFWLLTTPNNATANPMTIKLLLTVRGQLLMNVSSRISTESSGYTSMTTSCNREVTGIHLATACDAICFDLTVRPWNVSRLGVCPDVPFLRSPGCLTISILAHVVDQPATSPVWIICFLREVTIITNQPKFTNVNNFLSV